MLKKKDRNWIEKYSLALFMKEKNIWSKYGFLINKNMYKSEARRLIFKFLCSNNGVLKYGTLKHELRKRSNSISGALALQCQNVFLDSRRFKCHKDEADYIIQSLVRYSSTDETFEWMKRYIELVEDGELEQAEEYKYKHFLKSSGLDKMGIEKGEIIGDLKARKLLLKDKILHPEKYTLCRTGINKLDKAIGGFSKGEFILLAGHTSRGKSTLALNIAYKNHIRGKKILYFVNEMPKIQVQMKYDSIVSRISYKKFKFALISRKEIRRWVRKIKALKRFGGSFHTISLSSSSNITVIREMMKLYKNVDLIIVDSILYMENEKGGFSEQSSLGDVSRDLKSIAMEYHVPVLALTQLTTESIEKEQLDYTDIGYSRKLAFISDIILGIPGIQDDDESVIMQIVKNRDGRSNQFFKTHIDWETGRVKNENEIEKERTQESIDSFEN